MHIQRNIDSRKLSDPFILQDGGPSGMEEYGCGILKAEEDIYIIHEILHINGRASICEAGNWRDDSLSAKTAGRQQV